MPRGESVNSKMLEPHREIFGRGRRIVRQKKERRAGGEQPLNKIRRSRNEMILPVNHTVHVDQITCLHTCNSAARLCHRKQ